MRLAALLVGASLACAGASANATTTIFPPGTILTGDVCTNTCVGFADGDNTQDIFNLFGGGFFTGAFKLIIGANDYTLTMNGHTITFANNDPHLSISFNNPLLASFAPGAFEFIASGLYSPLGFTGPETVFDCPVSVTPGVPEPTTWAMMLIGFAMLGWTQRRRLSLRFWFHQGRNRFLRQA